MEYLDQIISKYAVFVGRIFVAPLFIISGFTKVTNFAGTVGFIASTGLPFPEFFAVVAILVEIGGGLSLLLGYQVKWGARALAVFTALAALIFHRDLANQLQLTMFLKNFAIVGSLILLSRVGSGMWSLDSIKKAPLPVVSMSNLPKI